jgi:hypothetical protein
VAVLSPASPNWNGGRPRCPDGCRCCWCELAQLALDPNGDDIEPGVISGD